MASTPFPLLPGEGPASQQALREVLRAVRRHRRLRPAEVARRMGMALRSYEHFEAGHARLNLERLNAFAEATDADAFAILASLTIGSPGFAVACADNKLMLILTLAVQDFDAKVGDDISRLAPRALITAFTGVFRDLAQEAGARDELVEAWLGRRAIPATDDPEEADT